MATYAPLFAHVDGWQWRPDMIWFDNLRSMHTASYYEQQMYGHNRGTLVVQTNIGKQPASGLEGQDGIFATTAYDNDAKDYIVKIANTSDKNQELKHDFKGYKGKFTHMTIETLHADDKTENTLDNPDLVKPVKQSLSIDPTASPVVTVPAKPFAIVRVK